MPTITLLGPQLNRPILKETLDALGITDGPLALITAGWEEREPEQDRLKEHVGLPTIDLKLYQRFDEVVERDRAFVQALHDRNDRLRTTQTLYRKRLDPSLQAIWELHELKIPRMELVMPERAHALDAVAQLDAHYLERIQSIHGAFEDIWDLSDREALAEIRADVARDLDGCAAVLIAGGDVGVLLDRLRLLGIGPLLAGRPLVAWSAGAMVLTERVVLFHDNPPQGRGNPEVYDEGLALAPNVVALPHASARLRLDDPVRVGIFANRFAPATCVALDEGCGLTWDGEAWTAFGKTRRLTKQGKLVGMAAP